MLKQWLQTIQKHRPIQVIDLEKTYVSYFDAEYPLEEILEGPHGKHPEYLLKNSIYVKFLEKLKNKERAADAEIQETEYYFYSYRTIQTTGICRQSKTADELMAQCRYFLRLYEAIKDRTYNGTYQDFITCENHSTDRYAWVSRIPRSPYSMIRDGHHRLACFYVLGKRFVKARIKGTLTHDVHATASKQL